MAQERGNAAILLLITIVALQSCSLWHYASAATHTVGGAKGWTLAFDYSTWAAGQTFLAGDILFFPYTQTEHDVVVVDKAGYDACSGANAAASYSDGNTSVTLTGTGTHYYLCSVLGHCASGMKLAVTVTSAASASPPSTAVAPTAAPPASAPSSPPVATPSIAPSPTSPPASAPAPAPSAKTPAPVPSPSSPAPASVPTVGPPASSPTAPGSTPSSAGSPPAPSPPNAAPSLIASATLVPLALLAALFAL